MKTTLEIPDELFRRTKATAAMRGESFKEFVTSALEARLEQTLATSRHGWRSVFGQAQREEVESVDSVVMSELERIDPDDWR
jgi:hypothetical protein